MCLCTERTFVHESIYAAFVAAFIKQTAEWSVGDPREPGIRLGPVVSTQHHAKVTSMLDRAAEKGFVAFGHSKRDLDLKEKNAKGCYVSPTVLTGVPDEDEIWNDEVFGPVTAINSFKTEDEVIKRANDTQYGLCATVFTEDIAKANRVARKIRAGTGLKLVLILILFFSLGKLLAQARLEHAIWWNETIWYWPWEEKGLHCSAIVLSEVGSSA